LLHEVNQKQESLKSIWPEIEKLIDEDKIDSCAIVIRLKCEPGNGEVLRSFFPGPQANLNEWIGIAECFKDFLIGKARGE